jgi:hypothetical protein
VREQAPHFTLQRRGERTTWKGSGVRERKRRGLTTDYTDGHGWGDACRIFAIAKLQQALVGWGGDGRDNFFSHEKARKSTKRREERKRRVLTTDGTDGEMLAGFSR